MVNFINNLKINLLIINIKLSDIFTIIVQIRCPHVTIQVAQKAVLICTIFKTSIKIVLTSVWKDLRSIITALKYKGESTATPPLMRPIPTDLGS